ncbi:tryptophan 2,3-dioxygenase family protein [Kitasatospora sp. NPDC058046]|uniref:tryptophan 2,3-dioxygenase family protein n=1 Tax=Kitasatospora sp. NPDC058046 TaxID=3346312 RepID=UPI0036D8E296
MRTASASFDEYPGLREWMTTYLTHEHARLGRRGAVCPEVEAEIQADRVAVERSCYRDCQGLSELCLLMREQVDRFAASAVDGALITVIGGMPAHHGVLLDEAQRRTRAHAARQGLMIGQFHSGCAEPAVWNPDFAVSRSPQPIFAIRQMTLRDILFLHADPALFEEYRRRFGDRYEASDSHIRENLVRLYRLACDRGSGCGSFADYRNTDILLSLQRPPTEGPAEMVHCLRGQITELLFKLLYEQARTVRLELASDRPDEAVRGLRGMRCVLDVLSHLLDLSRTVSPAELDALRAQSGTASGSDSYMYRMVEFSLGKKSDRLAAAYREIPGVAHDVYRALHESSVYDEALLLLARRGLIAEQTMDPRAFDSGRTTGAWAHVYRTESPDGDLFQLAEALMDVAEGMGRWGALRRLAVERVVGTIQGSSGSEDTDRLRDNAEYRYFPELWQARRQLASGLGAF